MQINTLALNMGRKLQKKQTGFVHYCVESEDLVAHDTIPVFQNALFALSLFRSRLSDHVLEGKALIEKLLEFEVQGNFPVYLHDFPKCFDFYLGLRLYPIFFWLNNDFGHVIGRLKNDLSLVMERILQCARKLELPQWAEQRVLAIEGGKVSVDSNLDEALINLQISEKNGQKVVDQIEELASYWHPELQLCIGSDYMFNQWGYGPEVNAFDLYMCSWQKKISERVLNFHPVHLKGALVRPLTFNLKFTSKATPFVHYNPQDKIPLWIAWSQHTFALAKKNLEISNGFEELKLKPKGKDEMAVSFYLDHHSNHNVTVDGKKASVFQKGQVLKIESVGCSLSLFFESDDGIYCGHLMRSNRPFQHACKGGDLYKSYDWKIALRTVRRGNSPIRVKFHLE